MFRINRHTIALAALLLFLLEMMPMAQATHAQGRLCFPNVPGITNCIEGRFRQYWEQNGGLPVFGYPVTPARNEVNRDTGQTYLTQWFERNRFELHPENARPYDVLLGRLGSDRLRQQGVDWRSLPRASGPQAGCLWFAETRHNVCDQAAGLGFKTYWQTHGLAQGASGTRLTSYQRSLALFGLPLSEPHMETDASGDRVLTQWFERARFEWHPRERAEYRVLLGRLGAGRPDDCSQVKRIAPGSTAGVAIGKVILAGIVEKNPELAQYAPFEFSEIRSIDQAGDWILFNASFKRVLEPALFVVQAIPGGYRYVGVGWGGPTPNLADIRAEVARVAPEAPPELITCAQTLKPFLTGPQP